MKKHIILLVVIVVLFACGKKKTSPPSETNLAPEKAILTLPATNSVCLEGTVVNTTTSNIQFTWQKAVNAESYELIIKNLLDNTSITKTLTATQMNVELTRNVPYAWQVTSFNTKSSQTSVSELRKFYTAGVANVSHAPFAAENLQPQLKQQVTAIDGKITLNWDAHDVDNDIKDYDIYLGITANNLQKIKSNYSEKSIGDVSVISGTMYYWKVTVRDQIGNTSNTEVYNFTVK